MTSDGHLSSVVNEPSVGHGAWKRNVSFGFAVATLVLSVCVCVQNEKGIFLTWEKRPEIEDVKKHDSRGFRIPIRADREPTTRKLVHATRIFENGRRLEKFHDVRYLRYPESGAYATTDNGIWVMPRTGDVRNLVFRIPTAIPWWVYLPLYSITFGSIIWLYGSGGMRPVRRWMNRVPGPHLKQFWSLISCYPSLVPLLAILIMFGVFQAFVLSDVAPFFPKYHDQNSYLQRAYNYADHTRDKGWRATFVSHFFELSSDDPFDGSPNVNLPYVVSNLLVLFGNSRLTALSVHFLSWAVLLLVVYLCIKKLTGNHGFGWMASGLLVTTNMAMVGAGGIADFRLDFVAACWMGISVAFWILFLNQPKRLYAWLGSMSVCVLVFFRLISAAAIGLSLALVFALALHTFVSGRRIELRRAIGPLTVAGVWTLLLVTANYQFIYEYYFELSLETELASRGADKTWSNGMWNAIRFYPETLLLTHFGRSAIAILCTVVAAAVANRLCLRFKGSVRPISTTRRTAYVFVALAILVPLTVLTLNPHRVSHVAGIAVAPLVLFGVLLIISLWRPRKDSTIAFCGLLVIVVGTTSWGARLKDSAPFPGVLRRDAEAMNMVLAEITFKLRNLPEGERTLAVLDFLDAPYGAWFYGRERLNLRAPVVCIFPNQITGMETDEILEWIGRAAAVIAPRDPSILSDRPYHISESMRVSFDQTIVEVRSKFTRHSSFAYRGNQYDLYFRSSLSESLYRPASVRNSPE